MRCWIRLALPLATLALGACTTPPSAISSGGEDSSGSSGTTNEATTPGTTTPGDTTGGSQGGSATGSTTSVDPSATAGDTTMGIDPTTGGTTTDGTTTDGTTTDGTTMGVDPTTGGGSSSGGPLVCPMPCPANEICNMGMCEDACGGAWAMGTYDSCLNVLGGFDAPGQCGAGHLCVYYQNPIEATTCALQGCSDACDCPAPPMTGDAVVSCGDITNDGAADCYLSCTNGETCPDGMSCKAGMAVSFCMADVVDVPLYGNCDNLVTGCSEGQCVVENGFGACLLNPCGGAGDCGVAPPGAAFGPACGSVIFPPGGDECYLPCGNDPDCPTGMECYNSGVGGNLCMWPAL